MFNGYRVSVLSDEKSVDDDGDGLVMVMQENLLSGVPLHMPA